jgi:site-specific DNA recombinase
MHPLKVISLNLNPSLRQKLEVSADLSRKEIHRNAHSLEHQQTPDRQGYLERYEQARERIETLGQEKLERTAKSKAIDWFIRSIRGSSEQLTQFDEALWVTIVDSVMVTKAGGMIFEFKNELDIAILFINIIPNYV